MFAKWLFRALAIVSSHNHVQDRKKRKRLSGKGGPPFARRRLLPGHGRERVPTSHRPGLGYMVALGCMGGWAQAKFITTFELFSCSSRSLECSSSSGFWTACSLISFRSLLKSYIWSIWKAWETSKTGLPTLMNTASYILNLSHIERNTRHEFKPQDSQHNFRKDLCSGLPRVLL